MTDHHVWRVIKHPKQHIPAIIATFIIVGSLTALTVFTANTHEQAANVERYVTTQREVVVRSFCTKGITTACKRKAYTLIRGCLAYTPCRELLVRGEVAVAKPTLKPKGNKAKISNPGSSGTPASNSDSGSPEAASTGSPSPAVSPPGGSESTQPESKHHESSHPHSEQPSGGQEGSSGGATPESGGGSPPASSPAPSGGGSTQGGGQEVAEAPAGGSSGGSSEEPSTPAPAGKSGLETVVGGVKEVVGGVVETTGELTEPLCEEGLLGVRVCLPHKAP